MVQIQQVQKKKRRFLPLLLLGDEQESMIDRYLDRGELYCLYEDNVLQSVAVVTMEAPDVCELKNIATYPERQRKGYGRALLDFLCRQYADRCRWMMVGTGDSPLTLPFYESCGFTVSHRVPNFFLQYDHPIFEAGHRLVDMVYLRKRLTKVKAGTEKA